jgi:sarcosine oxidase subunit alpha
VQGPDAAEFLDRVYVNGWKALPVGRARYGLMLREDGIALDDGTTSRLSEHRFFMTTTTANAARVLTHLEYYLQVVWPELRVQVTSVTEEWASMALAGPLSRDVLAKVVDIDVSGTALPFMGVRDCRIAGVPGRVFRISFSGELAYELAVSADWGLHAWEAVMAAGRSEGIMPYGTEAMATLRIEKGHPAGAELNGQTNPYDLGLGNLVSTKKDFIGRRLLERPAMRDPTRPALVGLVPCDGSSRLLNGAHVVAKAGQGPSLGHITSTAFSAELGHPVALALVSGGAQRRGQRLVATSPLHDQTTDCEVTDPVFIDPKGTRLRA